MLCLLVQGGRRVIRCGTGSGGERQPRVNQAADQISGARQQPLCIVAFPLSILEGLDAAPYRIRDQPQRHQTEQQLTEWQLNDQLQRPLRISQRATRAHGHQGRQHSNDCINDAFGRKSQTAQRFDPCLRLAYGNI